MAKHFLLRCISQKKIIIRSNLVCNCWLFDCFTNFIFIFSYKNALVANINSVFRRHPQYLTTFSRLIFSTRSRSPCADIPYAHLNFKGTVRPFAPLLSFKRTLFVRDECGQRRVAPAKLVQRFGSHYLETRIKLLKFKIFPVGRRLLFQQGGMFWRQVRILEQKTYDRHKVRMRWHRKKTYE